MAKTYSSKQLATIISWCSGARLITFLESNGIRPVREVHFSNRTYREYDEAALTKCEELRAAHEAAKAAPKPKPTPALAADTALMEILQSLMSAAQALMATNKALGEKVDALTAAIKEHDRNATTKVAFDDDAHVGHFNFGDPETK